MPRIEGKIDFLGATVIVRIGPSALLVSELRTLGQDIPASFDVLGLLDTGAMCSAIDPRVSNQFNLISNGSVSIHTPSRGRAYVERDSFDLSITLGAGHEGSFEVLCEVIECELASQGFFALIGRDVLSRCVLTFDGPANRFILKFP